MALFMDIHTMDGPVSAEQVAGAHRADLETQGRYDVDYRQYWVDEEHGRIFSSRLRTPTPRSRYTARRTASSPTRSFRSPKAAEQAWQLSQTKVAHARPCHRGRAWACLSEPTAPETVVRGLIGTLVPGACWKIPPGMSTFE